MLGAIGIAALLGAGMLDELDRTGLIAEEQLGGARFLIMLGEDEQAWRELLERPPSTSYHFILDRLAYWISQSKNLEELRDRLEAFRTPFLIAHEIAKRQGRPWESEIFYQFIRSSARTAIKTDGPPYFVIRDKSQRPYSVPRYNRSNYIPYPAWKTAYVGRESEGFTIEYEMWTYDDTRALIETSDSTPGHFLIVPIDELEPHQL